MSRRALALTALVALVAVVAWYLLLISPKNSELSELEDQLDTAIAEEQSLRIALATLESVRLNDVAYLAAIGQMESGIPDEAELEVFIEEVTALAEDTGVKLSGLSPSQPIEEEGEVPLYRIAVSMNIEGDYFELLGFLFGLDDMERIVVVDSIAITPTGGAATDGEIEDATTTTTSTTTTSTTTTTTTVPGGTTTTVAGGTTTTSTTSSTTTTSTTTTSTTTTTVATIDENILSVSLTVSLYTRSPLLPVVEEPAVEGEESPSEEAPEGVDEEAGGEFGQSEFGIDEPDAPNNAGGTP